MDDFAFAAVLSAIAVGVVYAIGAGGIALGLPSALALIALCLAGQAALTLFMHSGLEKYKSAAIYAFVVFAAYFAAILSSGAFSSAARLSFLPFLLCLPAASLALKDGVLG